MRSLTFTYDGSVNRGSQTFSVDTVNNSFLKNKLKLKTAHTLWIMNRTQLFKYYVHYLSVPNNINNLKKLSKKLIIGLFLFQHTFETVYNRTSINKANDSVYSQGTRFQEGHYF